jgi:lysophospholipase L1-like esterase
VKRNIFKLLITNICIFIALWGCAEVTCYFLHKKVKPPNHIIKDDLFSILGKSVYTKDQDILFKLKPNRSFSGEDDVEYQTGKEGWRIGSEKIDNNDRSDITIIVVGDSCTFGLGVPYDKTYGAILEKKMNEGNGQKSRVYNFGVPGFTSFQCRKLTEKVVPSLKPTVVVCYIGANDGAPVMEYSDKEYYENINANTKSFLYHSLKYSNVFKLLVAKRYENKISTLEKSIEQLPQSNDWFKLALPDLIKELEQKGVKLDKNVFKKRRVSVDEFKENLLSIKALAEKHNATFIYIPNIWNKGNNLYYHEDYLFTEYMDIRRELERYKTEDVFIDISHPSAKGHLVIAEMLFELISEKINFLTTQSNGSRQPPSGVNPAR